MPFLVPAAAIRPRRIVYAGPVTLSVFVAALFLSAFLLFGVQPMFAKMVLPILGGSPAVWSVAMVFFQALLLAGYVYAHLVTRFFDIRIAVAVHIIVMACAFLVQPLSVAAGWGRPPTSGEAFWLLGLFAASVGLPFFAIAGNGPLLQAWFARTDHPQARNPYFLYAASNVGSFAALILYPLGIEPFFPLQDQSRLWMTGFLAVAALVGVCAAAASFNRGAPQAAVRSAEAASPRWRDRAIWMCLSFIPSGLLVAVTGHISTDIAAVPLLWVGPLALFLLTFVLAFRDRPFVADTAARRLQVWATALVILSFVMVPGLLTALTLHLGAFFVSAFVCHTALYARRPPAARLTEFYLFMSLGGVLGGIFCGLIAPHAFSSTVEYPVLLIAALLGHRTTAEGGWRRWAWKGGRTALVCVSGLLLVAFAARAVGPSPLLATIVMLGFTAAMMISWRIPQQVVPIAIAAVVAGGLLKTDGPAQSFRSFFGVLKVEPSSDGRFLRLVHGTTVHGAMRIKNDDGLRVGGRPEPTTYYTYEGAIGTAIATMRGVQGGMLPKVAVVGLGAGSLACHAQHGESWTFFEIDPLVVRIAQDPRLFRFLQDCAPDAPVVLGDARLTLADQPGGFSLIVVDAFSSDAIPAHLITKEALALYLSRLSPAGALVFHISNRHLDLRHVLARTAAEHGLVAHATVERPDEPFELRYRAGSEVMVLARHAAHLGQLADPNGWPRIKVDMTRRPWTDDFSNVLEAILDRGWPGSSADIAPAK